MESDEVSTTTTLKQKENLRRPPITSKQLDTEGLMQAKFSATKIELRLKMCGLLPHFALDRCMKMPEMSTFHSQRKHTKQIPRTENMHSKCSENTSDPNDYSGFGIKVAQGPITAEENIAFQAVCT